MVNSLSIKTAIERMIHHPRGVQLVGSTYPLTASSEKEAVNNLIEHLVKVVEPTGGLLIENGNLYRRRVITDPHYTHAMTDPMMVEVMNGWSSDMRAFFYNHHVREHKRHLTDDVRHKGIAGSAQAFAWLIGKKTVPPSKIAFHDGNRHNLSPENMHEAVLRSKLPYQCCVSHGGTQYQLGRFATREEVKAARERFRSEFGVKLDANEKAYRDAMKVFDPNKPETFPNVVYPYPELLKRVNFNLQNRPAPTLPSWMLPAPAAIPDWMKP